MQSDIERLPMVRLEPIEGGGDLTIGIGQAVQKLWAIGRYRSRKRAMEALLAGDAIETFAYRWQVTADGN